MKLTQKLIDEVISDVVGDEVLAVTNILRNSKNISEFEISSKIKIPVDTIRNYLYRLYNNNLVTFIRKKDKKKGWYIYYWNLNYERIKYLVTDLKRQSIEKLKERLKREEDTNFFSCINQCIRVDFEQATNFEYRCPECGELLNQENNSEKIEAIKKDILLLQKELSDRTSQAIKELEEIDVKKEKVNVKNKTKKVTKSKKGKK
jgi:transcription initiation factor TFIIE subunit alpha